MHEMGIVFHLAKTLDDMAAQQHITKYGSVTLQVGEVSGIMTDYFTDCWNYFRKKHPLLTECELKIEEIPAQGKPFDPNIHEAVMQGSNPDLPDESIDLVLEKGYKIGDDVIRHSKVRVVRND